MSVDASRRRVLFVCTHHSVRSPMAEALCRARFGDIIESWSAGAFLGESGDEGVDPSAVAALAEIGVEISDLRARSFVDLERAGADLCDFDSVIALTRAAFDAVQRAARGGSVALEYWPITDATAAADQARAHRAVRDTLLDRLDERFGPALS